MAFGSFVPLLLIGCESFIVCLFCKFVCPFEKCFLLKVTYEICHCQLYSKRILDTRSFLFALPLHPDPFGLRRLAVLGTLSCTSFAKQAAEMIQFSNGPLCSNTRHWNVLSNLEINDPHSSRMYRE